MLTMTKALIYLGLLIHLWVGIKQPLFGDEANSILMARQNSYQTLLTRQIEKIHPNGSYLTTKLFLDLGLGVLGIRVAHWLLFCLTLWPTYLIYKQLGLSNTAARVGLIIWTFSPYILLQSYLIRMYSYGIFFLVCSLYFTLNKKIRFSILMDILGIYFVSGYWIFVLAKCLALGRQCKLRILAVMVVAFLVNIYFAMNVSREISSYLSWLPTVRLPDLLSMSTALLGLTSTAYYEGYSQSPSSLLLTLGLFIPIMFLVILFLRFHPKVNNTENYFLRLTAIILFGYVAVGILCLVFHLPLFHIRQLFPVAIMSLLSLTFISIKNFQIHKLITLSLVVPLLLLGIKRTINYTSHQIYPDHMIVNTIVGE